VVLDTQHLDLPATVASVLPGPGPSAPGHGPAAGGTLHEEVELFKRGRISHAIDQAAGNWAEAARLLGLDRGNLHRLARRLGIER
jgi:anaerobic nitric oxide reductase transcription regulator